MPQCNTCVHLRATTRAAIAMRLAVTGCRIHKREEQTQ
jgi:hypothetical protein